MKRVVFVLSIIFFSQTAYCNSAAIADNHTKFYVAASAGISGYGTVWTGGAEGYSFALRVETAYFFNEWLGAGLLYNSSRCDIEIKDVGVIGKEIISFFGPATYGRYRLNRIILTANGGVGLLNWTFSRYIDYDYDYGIYTTSVGGFVSVGGNYMITRNFGVGLNLQSTIGALQKEYYKRYPTAMGCTVGINFNF